MASYFLDTSAQAVRIFYPPTDQAKVANLIQDADEVLISRYSWYEFYHTWIEDLIRIYHAAKASDTVGDVTRNLAKSFKKNGSTFMVLGFLQVATNEENDPEMIAGRARMLLEDSLDELREHYLRLAAGKKIREVDELACTMLEKYDEQEIVTTNQDGIPSVKFPEPGSCSRDLAKCNIKEFVGKRKDELEAARVELESRKRDEPFRKVVPEVIAEPKKAKGRNCAKISDWLMVTQAPYSSALVTIDEDWVAIAVSQGKTVHKIPIEPEFDKTQIKRRMAGEPEEACT